LRQINDAYRILIGKPEGKGSIVRPKQISKNVKYVYVVWKCVLDSTDSGWDPVDLYTTCMPMVTVLLNLWVGGVSWSSNQLTAS
jgi:hypothetical protein